VLAGPGGTTQAGWQNFLNDPKAAGPLAGIRVVAAGLDRARAFTWRAAAEAWQRLGRPYERALELAGSPELVTA